MTKYDISSTKLYSVTSNTKVVVNALEQDVTIYWIVPVSYTHLGFRQNCRLVPLENTQRRDGDILQTCQMREKVKMLEHHSCFGADTVSYTHLV